MHAWVPLCLLALVASAPACTTTSTVVFKAAPLPDAAGALTCVVEERVKDHPLDWLPWRERFTTCLRTADIAAFAVDTDAQRTVDARIDVHALRGTSEEWSLCSPPAADFDKRKKIAFRHRAEILRNVVPEPARATLSRDGDSLRVEVNARVWLIGYSRDPFFGGEPPRDWLREVWVPLSLRVPLSPVATMRDAPDVLGCPHTHALVDVASVTLQDGR